jgi:hypothetical protein
MDELLPALAGLIALVLVGLAVMIAGDRAMQGWRRAENEKLGRRQRQHELSSRLEQLDRAIAEQAAAITTAERELERAKEENEKLKAQLDKTELPFLYTVVPLESRDMHARVFRFHARNPVLGAGVAPPDPLATWEQGRMYAVAATNQAEARSVVDRLMPRHKGFTVINAGEPAPESGQGGGSV